MKIGFIGSGNMGGAIVGGIVNGKIASPADILISDKNSDALANTNAEYGVNTTTVNKEVAKNSDILFLCIIIDEIKGSVSEDTVIVSIVAGQSIEAITDAFGKKIKLIRVMPNTPVLVGEGMSALTPNENVTEDEAKTVLAIFNSFGKGEIVTENLMDAVTAASGSSPAYVFMMIEAMADAAVMGGLPRSQAYTFAAQAVMGSAKMVLETGKHPGELKDMVCSPAGTTIEAVATLEQDGFRNSIIDAMSACMNKSKDMGKK